jgi:hypothetical protein
MQDLEGDTMKSTRSKFSVALGTALFLQAFTSLFSGAVLFDPLVDKSDVGKTLRAIADHAFSAKLSVFMDIVTAIVIVWLAVLLFRLVREAGPICAGTALALYVLEAGALVMCKFITYALILTGGLYSSTVDQALIMTGQLLIQMKSFTYNTHVFICGVGAMLFYFLLFKTRALPSWIPLWGLITMVPVMIGVTLMAYGVSVPFFVMDPYVPFEFFAGAYILVAGLSGRTPAMGGSHAKSAA